MRARRRAVITCVSICLLVVLAAALQARHGDRARGEPSPPTGADTIVIAPSLAASPAAAATILVEAALPSPVEASPSQSLEPAAPPPPEVAAPIATAPPAAAATPPPTATQAPTVLENNQIIVYYGTPLSEGLGILGALDPEQAAVEIAERARTYDSLNGDLGAVGALDVIYSLAQAEPTDNGMYIRHLEPEHVERYLRLAEEHDLQLFLDLQIGRRQILDEVRGIEPYLLNPRVHVAIDPEYAVGPDGVPVATPGRITGDEINAVQEYLRELVAQHALPGKVLVVHQYMEGTVVDAERVEAMADVDFVLNMDGLGEVEEKKKKYRHFSSEPHSKHEGFNVFLIHDEYVLSEEEILQLSPVPRIVFYQ